MKILYATSIRYPSALANRIQVASMTKAFGEVLGKDFYLSGNDIKIPEAKFTIANLGVKKSYKLAWKTLLYAKQEGITHLYAREARLLFFVALYNLFFFRLKLVYAYEVHALLGRSFVDLWTDKFLSFFVYRYIFVTKALSDIYSKKYNVHPERTKVLPDGVDLSIFDCNITENEARNELKLPQGKTIIGYFGQLKTLNMDKGVADVIEALPSLSHDIIFIAVGGNDNDRAEYEAMAKEKGVLDRVIFIGHVTQAMLARYQKASDILLMPFPYSTHFAYYMSPLKMFEYMASSRPMITTDLPSIREILDEKTAVIVPPGDSKALAATISSLALDGERRKMIANNARIKVNDYTWHSRAQKIVAML